MAPPPMMITYAGHRRIEWFNAVLERGRLQRLGRIDSEGHARREYAAQDGKAQSKHDIEFGGAAGFELFFLLMSGVGYDGDSDKRHDNAGHTSAGRRGCVKRLRPGRA